jgi:signal transduction histidine kinase
MTPPTSPLDPATLQKLVRLGRDAALGAWVGPLAHELNSPLTTILIFSETLSRELAPDAERREDAMEIHRAGLRCRDLVQAVLRVARRPRSEAPHAVDLGRLVREVGPLVAHRLSVAGLALRLELEEGLPPALGGTAELEQVLLHLLDNAVRACDRGAKVTIRCRLVSSKDRLELSGEDTGCGMSETQLARAREPFFSEWPDGGAGLGLACCDLLVTGHGGSFSLDSRPGEGTRVQLRLPLER